MHECPREGTGRQRHKGPLGIGCAGLLRVPDPSFRQDVVILNFFCVLFLKNKIKRGVCLEIDGVGGVGIALTESPTKYDGSYASSVCRVLRCKSSCCWLVFLNLV